MVQANKITPSSNALTPEEYISFACREGAYSEDAPCPENDPRVLRAFLEACRSLYPRDPEPVVDVYGGYGFFRDPIDYERPGKVWAFATPVIDGCIGASSSKFASDLPRIVAQFSQAGDTILTDSFCFTDGYEADAQNLIRLNSPVADIAMPFEKYLESLTSERRKKYRRMVQDFQAHKLRFELSDSSLSSVEKDLIGGWLDEKWGEESGYAYRQSLWFDCVQKIRPQQALVMRVMDGAHPVFVQTMIVKNGWVYCQSIAKDEDKFYSGLAAYTDFKCVEQLCGRSPYHTFDPSCRTSLEDPESIGIAKRATVNKNCVKPLLAIGANLDAAMYEDVQGKEA